MSGVLYARPTSLEDALEQLAGTDAQLLAGGTALTLLRKQGLVERGPTIDLGAIPGLDGISEEPGGGLVIGAMATLRSIETSPVVRRLAPVLADVVGRVATVRIRNQATIGGNLIHADPAQDPPPILLVLDAEVEIAGPGGRRRLPLEGFFVDVFETILRPDEILVAIRVPPVAPTSRIGYEKFLPRTADDYATVSVAARLDVAADGSFDDVRIALGSAAAVPLRVQAAEAALRGASPSEAAIAAAAEAVIAAVDPMDDARGSADYKREMAGVWTRRLLRSLS